MPRKRPVPPVVVETKKAKVGDWREAYYYLHGEVYTEGDVRRPTHARGRDVRASCARAPQ